MRWYSIAKKKKYIWNRNSNIFSFRIPHQLMNTVDYIISTTGRYTSRSDFIKEAIRKLVAEELKLLHYNTPCNNPTTKQIKIIDIQEDENKDIDVKIVTNSNRA